ncbi:unnamed protein product, partial [Iphiclides podalirius]
MGRANEKLELTTTPSDLHALEEKGFILEKMIGEGSYAKRRAKYFVFLRFAENGDLLDFLSQHGALPENQSRLWMRQILSGMQYIHSMDVAHRDLKCENILITSNYNVKITDFGFARNVRQRDRDLLSETYCGSLSYAAPEVLKGIPYLPKLADMWSIGIIMYTMLNKALPFNETSVKKLYEKQILRKWRFRTNIVNQLSTECKKQVTMLMDPDAKARPTASSTVSGEWITMDPKLAKLTFLEESLLKQAEEEANMKERSNYVESEVERIAELRRKGRGKEGLKVLKATEGSCDKSQSILNQKHGK